MKLKSKTNHIFHRILLFVLIIGALSSCSRKKNKWVNRNFHAMNTYYNILYHGNLALEEGKMQIHETYEDDYWNILPVERLINTDDPVVYGQMVEVPPAVMPQRPKTKAEEEKAKSKPSAKPKTAEEAFSSFNNPQTNFGNQNPGQNNQDGRNQNMNQGGRNQNMNQGFNQGGMNPGGRNQNMNQGQGGFNQGGMNPGGRNQNMNQGQVGFNQGGMNQGGQNQNMNQGGMNPGGRNQNMNQGQGGFNQGGMNPGGRNQNMNQGFNQGGINQGGRNQNANQGGRGGLAAQSSTIAGRRDGGAAGMDDRNREEFTSGEAFKAAEDKAAKGIQKHNMLMDGEEYNPQMKDAFLLLGKARYYQKRYFPALEAFNYIINKYDDETVIKNAEIWREKTYMRLENHDRAIRNLNDILKTLGEKDEEEIVEVSNALAQAYLDTDRKEETIKALNRSIATTRNKAEKGRLLFIKGQIYQDLNQIDSANVAYNQVIALKRKSPRVYMINSYMEKSKIFDYKNGDTKQQLDTLKRLLADRENRPFLDIINYRTAEHFKTLDDMPEAIVYYNKSLRTNTSNHGLKERIYRTLGDYNFDEANYKEAGAYYDSTMINLPENSLDYRRLKRKRLSLNDVIMYEDLAAQNDSVLSLVAMNVDERKAYFQKHVDSLKVIAIAEAEKAKKDSRRAQVAGNMFGQQQSQVGSSRSFYFYDARQVSAGETSFRQIWGNRALQDNWRIEKGSDGRKKSKEESSKVDYIAAIEADPAFQIETYLEQIPEDEDVIQELKDDRDFAYYQLGVIYHEKFSEYELASNRLKNLLTFEPEERLVLPAKYNLYKIYLALENKTESEKWKNDILNNHPDSRYAKILRNPAGLRDDESNPIHVYNRLYKEYQAGKYLDVIVNADEYGEMFLGQPIVPKFELLKATAMGRLYGFEAYEQALDYVALAYPQSEEGKKAEEIIQQSLPKMREAQFTQGGDGNFNLIYPFDASNRDEAEDLQKQIDLAIEELEEKGLKTSIDIYSQNQIFVVVRGLMSKMGAEGFGEKLKKEKKYKIDRDNFGISSENYEVLLIHKRLDEYRDQFND